MSRTANEDGLALLAALCQAACTPQGQRLLGELAAHVRRAIDGEGRATPAADEAARLLARSARRDRKRALAADPRGSTRPGKQAARESTPSNGQVRGSTPDAMTRTEEATRPMKAKEET